MEEQNRPLPQPTLVKRLTDPKGVIRKNLKPMLYVAAAILVILASVVSGTSRKSMSDRAAASGQPPQPLLQDATEASVLDLRSQVASTQQKLAPMESGDQKQLTSVSAQQASLAGSNAPCLADQPCAQQGPNQQPQLTPVEEEVQQLAARDRALDFDSRFASNLVFARAGDAPSPKANVTQSPVQNLSQSADALARNRLTDEKVASAQDQGSDHRKPEVNIDSAAGPPYVLYEGTTLDAVLMNRLDGDSTGPVKVLVSNPVYSHDRQHELIPEGTVALGEARKIGSTGFGQQRRIALVFHRLIMPDGYSVDLDQFHGLDQIGEEGVKDKVNNHYLEIFGTSIALGVVAGAGQIEQGGGALTTSGSQAFTTGAAANISQSASTVLDRFLAIPPTLTVREGHRIKLYFMQDMLLPAYENHRIAQTF